MVFDFNNKKLSKLFYRLFRESAATLSAGRASKSGWIRESMAAPSAGRLSTASRAI